MHCKLFSYEKCVCFLFLVFLFILSCFGYRIDNFPMTDISNKKNSFVHTSSSSKPFSSIWSSSNAHQGRPSSIQAAISQHKIRHHHGQIADIKHSTALAPSFHNHRMTVSTGYSDANDLSSNAIQKRSFSKSNNHRRLWRYKPLEDVTWRAYKATHVFCAQFIARGSPDNHSHSLIFDIKKSYKGERTGNIYLNITNPRNKKHFSNVNFTGEYYLLFLNNFTSNAYEPNSFRSVAKPKHIKPRQNDKNIEKVCRKNFVPIPAKVVKLRTYNRNSTTVIKCKVSGFPIPKIRWKLQNRTLASKGKFYYIQYRRRESRIIIKQLNGETEGLYTCIAIGINNTVEESKRVGPPIVHLKRESRRTIVCTVNGTSIAEIYWTRNGHILKNDEYYIIEKIRKNVRKLTIKKEIEPTTVYTCLAKNKNNQVGSGTIQLYRDEEVECNEKQKEICGNRGYCGFLPSIEEVFCNCLEGYSGMRCETKVPSDVSRNHIIEQGLS